MNGPHSNNDLIGSRYRVTGFVGEGGMQYVYQAYDEILKRTVALKTPKNKSAEKRFLRSAVVSAKVNHPNVAKTLDYLEEGDNSYLIEELIKGKDLAKSIQSIADYIDPFLVARLFHYLAKGLAASHHAEVVHRDLKPTNIMVVGDMQLDQVKITDFGIAKMASEELSEAAEGGEDTISASATAVGALPYMAPEAINTPREVGLKADIWSLGAMMYEMLAGERPFGAGLQAVHRIVSGNYTPFPEFVTSNNQFRYLASRLIDIIESCLQIDPEARPTADFLVNACGDLCYPIQSRLIGEMKVPNNSAWGFIRVPHQNDVFYHRNCIYGTTPKAGEAVMFSKFNGGGADRALPVVRLKQA